MPTETIVPIPCCICSEIVLVQNKTDGSKIEDDVYCPTCYYLYVYVGEEYDDCEYDDVEFQRCEKCDGHDTCEDFGCAFKNGLGHMVHRPGFDY